MTSTDQTHADWLRARFEARAQALVSIFGGAASIDPSEELSTLLEILARPIVYTATDVRSAVEHMRAHGAGERLTEYVAAELPRVADVHARCAWTWSPVERWPDVVRDNPWVQRAHTLGHDDLTAAARQSLDAAAYTHEMLLEHVVATLPCVPDGAREEVARLSHGKLGEILAAADGYDPRVLDARYVEMLESLGDEPRKWARKLRTERAAQVTQHGLEAYGWVPAVHPAVLPPRRLSMLTKAVWLDMEQARRRPAGTVRAVAMDRILPMMTRTVRLPDRDGGEVLSERGERIGTVDVASVAGATIEAVHRGAHALATATGNRLLRSLVLRSHEQWNRCHHDPRKVVYQGGWAGLIEAIGASSDAHEIIRQIAMAGQCIQWSTTRVRYGGLWLVQWTPERRGHPGVVEFIMGDAMIPGYAAELKHAPHDSAADRVARRLVPELRYEPPMGGARGNDHGAIWSLHRLALLEMVDHAEELATHGAVIIRPDRWAEMAETARLPSETVNRTLAAWCAGESARAPALLVRDGDAWTLAEPHAAERDYIAEGGRLRAKGRRPRAKRGARR